MDFDSFQVKYGYMPPEQKFKGGARAGIIVAAMLSVLAMLLNVFLRMVILPYYGGGEETLSAVQLMAFIAAALMVIMAGVAKPSGKIVLALPATVWLVYEIIALVVYVAALRELGAPSYELMSAVVRVLPGSIVYPIVVAVLMWVCCAGSGKGGTVCGVIITVTAIIGFFIAFLGSFFGLLEAIDYDSQVTVVLSMNIFAAVAGMLFYIANAAALFMVGAKPKVQPYWAATANAPAQANYNNTEVK